MNKEVIGVVILGVVVFVLAFGLLWVLVGAVREETYYRRVLAGKSSTDIDRIVKTWMAPWEEAIRKEERRRQRETKRAARRGRRRAQSWR